MINLLAHKKPKTIPVPALLQLAYTCSDDCCLCRALIFIVILYLLIVDIKVLCLAKGVTSYNLFFYMFIRYSVFISCSCAMYYSIRYV